MLDFKNFKVACSGLALLTMGLLTAEDIAPQQFHKTETAEISELDLTALAEVPAPSTMDDDEVLVCEIKGLLIGPSTKGHGNIPKKIHGVVFKDLTPPGECGDLGRRLTPIAIGQPLTRKVLEELRREIVLYYRENDRPIVMVVVPEQDVTDGVLQLAVIEGKVGDVIVKGQRHFSEHRIRKNIHLEKGDAIDSDQLLTDVQWLNQNPFRQTNIVFGPGEKNGTTNVELITKDRLPFRIYAGGDNTGTPLVGRTRLFTGINWGNVFGLDHILSFQWTTSDDVHKFLSYTGSYSIPLPWRHTLSFFGGYSSVRPHLTGLRSEGWSAQASARYKIPIFQTYGVFQQDIQIGYDFKETNNNLLFAGTSSAIETKVIQLGQFVGTYHFSYLPPKHILNFDLDVILSPAQNWYDHQTTADYHKLQPGSSPIYTYAVATVMDDYAFSSRKLHRGWRLFYQGRIQMSNKILLPSEQFSLGGYYTVRGYNERLVNYDNAGCVNIEIRTPNFEPWRYAMGKNINEGFYALAFIDYGYGWPHRHAKPKEKHLDAGNHTLIGVGPGLRYSINRYFTARCDLGFPLTTVENNGRSPHIHFGLLASY